MSCLPVPGFARLSGLSAAVAVAALLAVSAPLPAAAQSSDQTAPPAAQAAPQTAPAAMPQHRHRQARAEQGVEARIADLHRRLQITPDEENQWNAVAQVMRDNQKNTAELIANKRQNEAGLTAKDDMSAYADIAEAHASGARRMADAFATLYDGMPDAQKKVADQVFRQHKRRAMRHGHGK